MTFKNVQGPYPTKPISTLAFSEYLSTRKLLNGGISDKRTSFFLNASTFQGEKKPYYVAGEV